MVKFLLFAVLGLCSLNVLAGKSGGVKVEVDKHELALGESLVLTLHGSSHVLDTLDIKTLENDFDIHGRVLSHDEREAALALTLYPRHSGRIQLPVLAGLAKSMRAIRLSVLDGSQTIPQVWVFAELQPDSPLVKQPVRLMVEACDDGSLQWKAPVLPTLEGVQIRYLGQRQTGTRHDELACTAHRWYWALTPLAAGAVRIPLPTLEAQKFGQQLRYPPAMAELKAHAIPGWLPREAAIGAPEISAGALPKEWPVQRPLPRTYDVVGAYSPSDLKQVLAIQLARQPAFSSYQPAIDVQPQTDPDTVQPRYTLTLYALPDRTGELVFPDLVFPYLDPATGQMTTISQAGGTIEIFNPLTRKVWKWTLGLAGLILAAVVGMWLKRAIEWRLARRRGLKAIADADDIPSLALALRSFSLRLNETPAVTLGVWLERMQAETTGVSAEAVVKLVEAVRYGRQRADQTGLADLQRQARELLVRCKPRNQVVLWGRRSRN